MIQEKEGNLLDAKVEALVNTVNCVGVMGRGIALMFRHRYPENYQDYRNACEDGKVELGRMLLFELKEKNLEQNQLHFEESRGEELRPRYIFNFPTKDDWRCKSKLEWIDDGLKDLARLIEDLQVRSIALPRLGVGNGGLDWERVKQLIDEHLGKLENVEVYVYEPSPELRNVTKRNLRAAMGRRRGGSRASA